MRSRSRLVIMDDIDEAVVLTAEQEQQLARTIEIGLIAAHRLGGAQDLAGCPGATESELARLVEEGESARQTFLAANLGLVGIVSHPEARRRGLPAEELFQEGVVGLLNGLQRYDHRRGIRFAPYALYWIRAAVQEAVNRRYGEGDLRGIRADQIRMVRAVRNRMVLELCREPCIAEVAAEIGRPESWVADRWDVHRPMSLSGATGDAIDVVDERATTPLDEVVDGPAVVRDELLAALSALQREVVRRRFGFGGAIQSYRQVSLALGISLSTARRVEHRALDRLRANCGTGIRPLAA